MLGSILYCAPGEDMLRNQIKYVGRGEDSLLLVFTPPAEALIPNSDPSCMAIPVLPRAGGFLLAVPDGYFANDVILEAALSEEGEVLGPSSDMSAPLLEEDDSGFEVAIGYEAKFLLIDVSDAALSMLREYDPVIDPSSEICPYSRDRPLAILDIGAVMPNIHAWLDSPGGAERMNFYSAREEQQPPLRSQAPKASPKKAGARRVTAAALAETVAALTDQVKLLAAQQETLMQQQQQSSPFATPVPGPALGAGMSGKLPAVSAGIPQSGLPSIAKVAQLLGPPPKSKPPGVSFVPDVPGAETMQDVPIGPDSPTPDMSHALLQQSHAITTLVAHLTQGDPLSELGASSSSSQGLHTKGVARRERMQQELAGGQSNFYLQVQQQIFKRMFPSRPLPKDESELISSGVSLCHYLEKFGGYKNQSEMAMIMWMLAHSLDASASGNNRLCREYLALTVACIEQSVMDRSWNLAYVLSLLEEPPTQVFSERSSAVTSLGRPFAPLVPPPWAAVALAYLKELDLLSNRKTESKANKQTPAKAGEQDSPSPKRRPKFPKRPKQGVEAPTSSN